jgi:hypothetical protein
LARRSSEARVRRPLAKRVAGIFASEPAACESWRAALEPWAALAV